MKIGILISAPYPGCKKTRISSGGRTCSRACVRECVRAHVCEQCRDIDINRGQGRARACFVIKTPLTSKVVNLRERSLFPSLTDPFISCVIERRSEVIFYKFSRDFFVFFVFWAFSSHSPFPWIARKLVRNLYIILTVWYAILVSNYGKHNPNDWYIRCKFWMMAIILYYLYLYSIDNRDWDSLTFACHDLSFSSLLQSKALVD